MYGRSSHKWMQWINIVAQHMHTFQTISFNKRSRVWWIRGKERGFTFRFYQLDLCTRMTSEAGEKTLGHCSNGTYCQRKCHWSQECHSTQWRVRRSSAQKSSRATQTSNGVFSIKKKRLTLFKLNVCATSVNLWRVAINNIHSSN